MSVCDSLLLEPLTVVMISYILNCDSQRVDSRTVIVAVRTMLGVDNLTHVKVTKKWNQI